MNQSRIIDSWIAELGAEARRNRREEDVSSPSPDRPDHAASAGGVRYGASRASAMAR
jgi:hypothetical protein